MFVISVSVGVVHVLCAEHGVIFFTYRSLLHFGVPENLQVGSVFTVNTDVLGNLAGSQEPRYLQCF
jgi:hypothetical protein